MPVSCLALTTLVTMSERLFVYSTLTGMAYEVLHPDGGSNTRYRCASFATGGTVPLTVVPTYRLIGLDELTRLRLAGVIKRVATRIKED